LRAADSDIVFAPVAKPNIRPRDRNDIRNRRASAKNPHN
jgi:hypothetical protein